MIRRLSLLAAICAPLAAQTGALLAPWTPGTLDIHHISTGRGNATFFILPDGTTLLIDTGAAADGAAETDPHGRNGRSFEMPRGSAVLAIDLGHHLAPSYFRQLVEEIDALARIHPLAPAMCRGPTCENGL